MPATASYDSFKVDPISLAQTALTASLAICPLFPGSSSIRRISRSRKSRCSIKRFMFSGVSAISGISAESVGNLSPSLPMSWSVSPGAKISPCCQSASGFVDQPEVIRGAEIDVAALLFCAQPKKTSSTFTVDLQRDAANVVLCAHVVHEYNAIHCLLY